VALLSCPSIDERHLVNHTYCWTSHTLDKTRSSHYASFNLCMHNGHTIKINYLWCDSLSVDFNVRQLSTSATVVVVESEDLELLVLRDN
jgi:hypothetical protein